MALPLHQLGLEFSDGDHVGPGVVVLGKDLGNSPEWLTLKGALAEWSAEFKFCDVWIERIALCTLQKYTAGWSESDKDFCDWRLKPDLEPKPNFTAPHTMEQIARRLLQALSGRAIRSHQSGEAARRVSNGRTQRAGATGKVDRGLFSRGVIRQDRRKGETRQA